MIHPAFMQRRNYNINTVFELIDASGLEFLGFSNPQIWDLERLIGKAPELIERSQDLSYRQRYRLIELLDPQVITHYEFFLGRNPIAREDRKSDVKLMSAIPEPSPCIQGWRDSQQFFNHDYQIVRVNDAEWHFLLACDGNKTTEQILQSVDASLEDVRSLQKQQIILLTPTTE
jgi:hypothetical protein